MSDCSEEWRDSVVRRFKELELRIESQRNSCLYEQHRVSKETEIFKLLRRLAEGCRVRKVGQEWPALESLICKALEITK